jgi:hypothetical protein
MDHENMMLTMDVTCHYQFACQLDIWPSLPAPLALLYSCSTKLTCEAGICGMIG